MNSDTSTRSRSSRARSHRPQTSSPAPPASAIGAPSRAATTAMLAVTPPKWGEKRLTSVRAAPRCSPTRSTSASPRHRVRDGDRGAHRRVTLSSPVGGHRLTSTSTPSRSPERPVFYRRAPATGATALYLHSVPTSSDDWRDFLAADRRRGPRSARLRPLRQGRPPRLLAQRLRRLSSSGCWPRSSSSGSRSSATAGAPPSGWCSPSAIPMPWSGSPSSTRSRCWTASPGRGWCATGGAPASASC